MRDNQTNDTPVIKRETTIDRAKEGAIDKGARAGLLRETKRSQAKRTGTAASRAASVQHLSSGQKNASMDAFPAEVAQKSDSPLTDEVLLNAALQEAEKYEKVCQNHDRESDKASWSLLKLMLQISETFDGPRGRRAEGAFETFLEKHGAPKRANAGSVWHRLAKACTTKGMASSRRSKLGGALAGLCSQGVRANTVMQTLEDNGGANHFTLLYRKAARDDAKRARDEAGPVNPFTKFEPVSLKAQGLLLLQALKEKGLLPAEYHGLEAALRASN